MSRALFVSDIHIRSTEDPKCGLFERFLDKCLSLRPANLFLVGDIFDLWIADRDFFVETYGSVIGRIKILVEAGVQIHYFEGNHDLDLKMFWQDRVGVSVFESAAYFEIENRIVRVEHGDQMDPDDKGYLFLRWLLRTPLVRGMGRVLPSPVVRVIGERASRASRDYTSTAKAAADEEVRAKFARHIEKAFAERPFDVLVAGHVHVADDVRLELGGRGVRGFNLGTWLKEPLVLELHNGRETFISVDQFLR